MSKSPKICVFPNCRQVVWAKSLCQSHYNQMRHDCILNGSWGQRDEEEVVRVPWTYEGDEDALAKMTAEQETGKTK
jgi:hypothetical protein